MTIRARTSLPAIALAFLLCVPVTDAPAECPGGGGPGRRLPPPPLPGTPTTPGTAPPVTGGGGDTDGGSTRGRVRVRTAASIDARTWEYWWALNQAEYLPVSGYQHRGAGSEGYAPGRSVAREAAMDVLLDALEDEDNLVRTAAARSLTVVDFPYRRLDQIRALEAGLQDDYREVREIAGLALSRRGATGAAEVLRGVLKRETEHRVTRAFAAMALVGLGDDEGIALARRISNEADDADLAGAILIGFGASGDRAYVDHLLQAMRRKGGSAERRRRVHCDAMMALGKLGDPAAVKAIAKKLTDRERLIQRAAALALGGFAGSDDATKALLRHGLSARDHLTRAFAVISLARLGNPEAQRHLAERAGEERDVVQSFALLGLGIGGTRAAAPLLREPLETRQREGQFGAAALATGMLRVESSEKLLADVVGGLSDPSAEGYACVGLGLLGAKSRGAHLKQHLWIDSSRLQFGVPVGLSYLDARDTAQWLDARLAKAERESERGPLIDAVSLMGGDAELQTLVDLYRKSPRLTENLKRRLLYAMARILKDHEPGFPYSVCTHTYFPFNNDVLAHLRVFP